MSIKGYWIYKEVDNFRKYSVECSNCNVVYYGDYDQITEPENFNFCPNCGTKMDNELKSKRSEV